MSVWSIVLLLQLFITYCVYVVVSLFFFFFKQKTAYEMRISDWSSDVCSSDLDAGRGGHLDHRDDLEDVAEEDEEEEREQQRGVREPRRTVRLQHDAVLDELDGDLGEVLSTRGHELLLVAEDEDHHREDRRDEVDQDDLVDAPRVVADELGPVDDMAQGREIDSEDHRGLVSLGRVGLRSGWARLMDTKRSSQNRSPRCATTSVRPRATGSTQPASRTRSTAAETRASRMRKPKSAAPISAP